MNKLQKRQQLILYDTVLRKKATKIKLELIYIKDCDKFRKSPYKT